MLGLFANQRFQKRNGCEMPAYLWQWLMINLADVTILCTKTAGILTIALSMFFHNKVNNN